MPNVDMIAMIVILLIIFASAFPIGRYMAAVFAGERVFLTPVLAPIERIIYRLGGINPAQGMGWKGYAFALLLLNALHFLILYAILRLQFYLPFNPQHITGMSPQLALNTSASFVTNTNWQAYSPESQISYGAQMFGLTVHNYLSAATGIAAALAVVRAFCGSRLTSLGNFFVDMVRATLYLLLPIGIIAAVVLLASGVPETLSAYADVTTLEGPHQTIAFGPVAFQEAIKMLGTNGGGFFNANSAHPFENPTAFTNAFQIWLMLIIPFSLPIMFGHMARDLKQGVALFSAMAVLLVLGIVGTAAAELHGNSVLTALGVDPSMGNMEGKETRFGVGLSAMFNVAATGTSCGAVDSFTDSYTAAGGLIPLFLMQLGEVAPGGIGSGLYSIIVFALLSVFVAGLMVGRTPEYLGKKVEAREMKLAMLALLILTAGVLVGGGVSIALPAGQAALSNAGPHGLSEMLYAYTSATENNGSAFAGLTASGPLLLYGQTLCMLLGRFAFLVPVLAIAGSLAAKPKLPASAGTFPTHQPLFVGLLCGVIIILGGLQFMPADALGPLADQVTMNAGKLY